MSPRESPFFSTEKTEKIAEFKGARVAGRKEGKKVWEFEAKEGWTTSDSETTHLQKVTKGKIYKDGKLVISDLTSPQAKAYRHSEIVEVFGPVKAYLNLGRIADPQNKDRKEWTRMTADSLKYLPKEKRSEIRGNVTLLKKDSSIFAENININHNNKTAYISDNITLKRKDGILNSLRMEYIGEEEELIAEKQVDLKVQEGSFKTRVKCDRASFFTNYQKDMDLKGNIEISQGKKLAIGEEGVYSQKNKTLDLKGNVKAVFEKAQIILKKESIQNLKNPEAKTILEEKTILTSEKLVLSTITGNASASGSVHVFQKGKEAKGDSAEYNEKKETLTLAGNVSMKKDADWVKCRKVVVSVKDETFEAFGQVEAEFKL